MENALSLQSREHKHAMPSASVAKFQRSIAPKGDLWACARELDIRQWSTIKGIPLALTSAWFIDAGAALSRTASVVVRTVVIKIWFAVFVSIVTSIEWNCTCISFVLKSAIEREKKKCCEFFFGYFVSENIKEKKEVLAKASSELDKSESCGKLWKSFSISCEKPKSWLCQIAKLFCVEKKLFADNFFLSRWRAITLAEWFYGVY